MNDDTPLNRTRHDQPQSRGRGCVLLAILGSLAALVGGGLFGYWLLFMSWSHSYLAPAFQARERLVLGGVAVCGFIVLATTFVGIRRWLASEEPSE